MTEMCLEQMIIKQSQNGKQIIWRTLNKSSEPETKQKVTVSLLLLLDEDYIQTLDNDDELKKKEEKSIIGI